MKNKNLFVFIGTVALAVFSPNAMLADITTDAGGVEYWSSGTGWTTLTAWGAVPTNASVYLGPVITSVPGPSQVTMDGGSTLSVADTTVGGNSNNAGSSLTVTGAGSLWNCNAGWLIVGDGSAASLLVSDGGRITTAQSVAIGYQSNGSAVIDGGSMDVEGYFFVNRFSTATESSVLVKGGGEIITHFNNLANWGPGSTGTLTVEDGLAAFDYVESSSGATTVLNIGPTGSLALNADGETIADFVASFIGAGTTQLNIWNGSAYVNYTTLTEGVDYQVVAGTGDLFGKKVLSLAAIPEPSSLLLLAMGAVGLMALRRRGKA